MDAAIWTGVTTLLAALIAAGIVSLVRLGSATKSMHTEMRVRFTQNSVDHHEIKTDMQALRKESREYEQGIDHRLLAENWRRNHG